MQQHLEGLGLLPNSHSFFVFGSLLRKTAPDPLSFRNNYTGSVGILQSA